MCRMKVVVTRVKSANVKVDEKVAGAINEGLLVLVGFTHTDTIKDIDYIVNKIVNLRIFNDESDIMNKSALQLNKEILSVSQFTLYADATKGRRPSYTAALDNKEAIKLYEIFNNKLREYLNVETGIFGADMQVESINDGPVTIIIESR